MSGLHLRAGELRERRERLLEVDHEGARPLEPAERLDGDRRSLAARAEPGRVEEDDAPRGDGVRVGPEDVEVRAPRDVERARVVREDAVMPARVAEEDVVEREPGDARLRV